jgi:hypothetical protein
MCFQPSRDFSLTDQVDSSPHNDLFPSLAVTAEYSFRCDRAARYFRLVFSGAFRRVRLAPDFLSRCPALAWFPVESVVFPFSRHIPVSFPVCFRLSSSAPGFSHRALATGVAGWAGSLRFLPSVQVIVPEAGVLLEVFNGFVMLSIRCHCQAAPAAGFPGWSVIPVFALWLRTTKVKFRRPFPFPMVDCYLLCFPCHPFSPDSFSRFGLVPSSGGSGSSCGVAISLSSLPQCRGDQSLFTGCRL